MSHIIRHNKCGRHDNARLLCARSSRGTRELQRCRGFRKSRAVYLRRMRCTLRRSNWFVRLCISSVCHIHLYYICGNCTLEIIFNRFVSLWLYSKRNAKEISFVFDLVIGYDPLGVSGTHHTNTRIYTRLRGCRCEHIRDMSTH